MRKQREQRAEDNRKRWDDVGFFTALAKTLSATATPAGSFARLSTRVDPMNPEKIRLEDAEPETDEGEGINGVTVKKEKKGENRLKTEDPAGEAAKLHASLDALGCEAAAQSDEDEDILQKLRAF